MCLADKMFSVHGSIPILKMFYGNSQSFIDDDEVLYHDRLIIGKKWILYHTHNSAFIISYINITPSIPLVYITVNILTLIVLISLTNGYH